MTKDFIVKKNNNDNSRVGLKSHCPNIGSSFSFIHAYIQEFLCPNGGFRPRQSSSIISLRILSTKVILDTSLRPACINSVVKIIIGLKAEVNLLMCPTICSVSRLCRYHVSSTIIRHNVYHRIYSINSTTLFFNEINCYS